MLVQGHSPRLRLVAAKRTAHLIAGDVRRLTSLLHVHPELDHVQEELEEILILGVAALDRETQERFPLLQGDTRRECDARALARRDDVERVLRFIQHETLHPLAHANASVAGDAGGKPSAAGRDGDGPTLFIRRLNRSRAGAEGSVEVFAHCGFLKLGR